MQGPISPDNLLLVGSHRWLPTDETQLATWKLAQYLTDHPGINAKLPKTLLTHLVEKYCFNVIREAVLQQAELPNDHARLQCCLDLVKAQAALTELKALLPSEEGKAHVVHKPSGPILALLARSSFYAYYLGP